jgi:hypothetical protein
MAFKCFMCGAPISKGILCEKCDKPRKKSGDQKPLVQPPPAKTPTPPPMPAVAAATAPATFPEEFPKAPVLHFPVESASPSITSVANVLIAGGVAAIVVGPDHGV